MMTQAYYTGLSGLVSTQRAIDITSDNIANSSTVGFRSVTTEFTTLFEDAVNTPTTQQEIGLGSRVNASSTVMSNGSIKLTDKSTDLSIDGDGWFGVVSGDELYYTRAGDFVFDSNNDLITRDGKYVLGTMAGNIDGNILTSEKSETPLSDINTQETLRFPTDLTYPAVPTKNTQFFGNLGIEDETKTFGATVIDKDNNKNDLQLRFTKSSEQNPPGTQWDVTAILQSLDGTTVYDTQNGQVSFDENGALISNTLPTINNNGTDLTIDLGEGYSGIVATNNTSTTGSSQSDGTIGGELVGYEINRHADVIATFTNGRQSSVGKIGLFHFSNDQGLDRISGTLYKESSNSGNAFFYKDQEGNNILGSDVMNYSLENSNVSMSNALTELIVYQRSFDANSKIISTADQMIQKALSMDS